VLWPNGAAVRFHGDGKYGGGHVTYYCGRRVWQYRIAYGTGFVALPFFSQEPCSIEAVAIAGEDGWRVSVAIYRALTHCRC
jgi:hypothetical protein